MSHRQKNIYIIFPEKNHQCVKYKFQYKINFCCGNFLHRIPIYLNVHSYIIFFLTLILFLDFYWKFTSFSSISQFSPRKKFFSSSYFSSTLWIYIIIVIISLFPEVFFFVDVFSISQFRIKWGSMHYFELKLEIGIYGFIKSFNECVNRIQF